MGWFADNLARVPKPTEGTRSATTTAPTTGGYRPTAEPATRPASQGPMSEEEFLSALNQARMTGYGYVDPTQVDYYLKKRYSGETSDWATGDPGRTMDDYWIARATGMGAGGPDAALYGQWAGGDDPYYGQPSTFGGMSSSYQGGGGLPPGFTIGDITGGGKYPLSSFGGVGLTAPWTTPFVAPTGTEDPGYGFRQAEGQKAIERSAAAKGTLLTGGTIKDLANYSQGLASQEYGNAYNRAFNEYMTAYGIFDRNQANTFGRLSGLANMGASAAGQSGSAASSYANMAGDMMAGIGNSQAAGTVGAGNASASMWGNIGNTIGGLVSTIPYWQRQQRPPTGYNLPPGGG